MDFNGRFRFEIAAFFEGENLSLLTPLFMPLPFFHIYSLKSGLVESELSLQPRQISQIWKVSWNTYWISLDLVYIRHKYPTAVVYTTCFINRGTPNTNSSSTASSKQKQTTLLCYKRCQQPFTFYAPFWYLWLVPIFWTLRMWNICCQTIQSWAKGLKS